MRASPITKAVSGATLALIMLGGSAPALADTGPCGQANGGTLPDLSVDRTVLKNSIVVTREKFRQSSCSVVEGFTRTPGPATLLRFTTSTPNTGAGDLVIGNPQQCPGLFELSACHEHYHFHDYAENRLWTEAGWSKWIAARDLRQPVSARHNAVLLADAVKAGELLVGYKQAFCMIDSLQYSPTANPTPKYTECMTNQGISAGWTDRYDLRLDGQWIQVDNLKEGLYVLEVHVNANHGLSEESYENNSSAVTVRYTPPRGQLPPVAEVIQ